MAPSLERALETLAPGDWIAIGVTLREEGLATRGAARLSGVAARQQSVLEALPGDAFHLGRRYRWLAGFAGSSRRAAVEALRRHPEVRSVYLDGRVEASLNQGVPLIGADDAQALGLTGEGVNVAVLDSGIDTDHPDLSDDLVAEQCYCSDPNPAPVFGSPCCPNGEETQSGPGAAEDGEGHGTNVSGIVTSAGGVAQQGVAPDAGIVAIRVLGSAGGAFSDVAAGLDWVLVNRDAFADPIRVVNLSLGDGVEHSDPASSPCSGSNTANAISSLVGVGVVVFAASGNEGFDDGISFPACVDEAISVGGVYDASFSEVPWCGDATCTTYLCTDTDVGPDDFVCHSNSNEILDLLAPNYATSTTRVGGGVQNYFGGTSASSPYAAAQAALLLEADASLSPQQVRDRLVGSGPSVTNPDNGLSFPRSDVGVVAADLMAFCGDGVVGSGESCDDGNTLDGDCCASDCSVEASGSVCEDGNACTTEDTCDGAGSCVGGPPPVCDDGNVCTDDACDPALGCVTSANTAVCDDGDACTTQDTCEGGSCVGGAPPVCDDGNVCTDDACDPALGCVTSANTAVCDDGDACTTEDTCEGGSCMGGPPADCDDGDPCTAESCDAIEGCVSTPVEGCSPPVPSLPGPWGLPLVLALPLAGGAWIATRHRWGKPSRTSASRR